MVNATSSPAAAPALPATRGLPGAEPALAAATAGMTDGESRVSEGFAAILATEIAAAPVSADAAGPLEAQPASQPAIQPAALPAADEAATRQPSGKILPDAGKAVAAALAVATHATAEPGLAAEDATPPADAAREDDPRPAAAAVATLAALPQVAIATAPAVQAKSDAAGRDRPVAVPQADAAAKPVETGKSPAAPAQSARPAEPQAQVQPPAERPAQASAIAPPSHEAVETATILQQPIVALRDAGPAGQALAVPTVAAAPAAPVGHDFAALVDRLVEARDLAMPRIVQAAVAHAEFGQVSMRFEQVDGGLSVSLASPDPDFARAVQAAAPAQAQAGTSDTPSRNDAQNSQQGGSGQAAAQSQANAQSHAQQQQHGRSAERGAESGQHQPGADEPESAEPQARRRAGIFA